MLVHLRHVIETVPQLQLLVNIPRTETITTIGHRTLVDGFVTFNYFVPATGGQYRLYKLIGGN